MTNSLKDYEGYMQECMKIALNAEGLVYPPYVGCIILNKYGKKISEGWRQIIGGSHLTMHAERNAIFEATESVKGGTLITTLEPCTSPKNTDGDRREGIILKPCSRLIVEAGISQVIYAHEDRNDCGGIKFLRNKGVKLTYLDQLDRLVERELFIRPMQVIAETKKINYQNY